MSGKTKKQLLYFDHIAIAIGKNPGDLERYEHIFELLGFDKEWQRNRIGNKETAMKTAVLTRGKVKLALMEGIDGKNQKGAKVVSQVNEYYQRFGLSVQHIALRCSNLQKLLDEWSKAGVRFLTEDKNRKPKILVDEENSATILQCFTYPINKTLFFELKQIVKGKKNLKKIEEFRDANVEGLWASLDRALKEGWLFEVNIFGEKK